MILISCVKLKTSVKQNRLLISLFIFLFMALHASGQFEWSLISTFENKLYDLCLIQTMPNQHDPRIVIVDIDEKSIQAEGRWPWHRDKLADLVNTLFDEYQIRVAGFDMVFAEADDVSAGMLLNQLADEPMLQNDSIQTLIKNKQLYP